MNIGKKQRKLKQILDEEVAHAYPANGIYYGLGGVARLFSKRLWEHAQILLFGAILSPAERKSYLE